MVAHMKAWVLHNINSIRYEDVNVSLPGEKEVLVHVKAVGICGSDIPRIYETGAHKMPLIPGHEFAGVVEGIGQKVDTRWMGRRVGVYPLIACGRCKPCLSGYMEMCRDYDYIGSRRDGAFAEYVIVPAENLIEIPDEIPFEVAAMLEPMAVAVHAMMKGIGDSYSRLPLDNVVAVCGLGPIGMLIIGFLMDAGYQNVYAIGNRSGQRNRVERAGLPADHYCDSTKKDPVEWIRSLTGGADIYFDCTGRNDSLIYGISGAAPGGRIVAVGNPHSDMALSRDVYWKILRNQLTIMGTWNSSFCGAELNNDYPRGYHEGYQDDWNYVMGRLIANSGDGSVSNRIEPALLITHKFTLDSFDTAISMMWNKTEDYCKVMITNE